MTSPPQSDPTPGRPSRRRIRRPVLYGGLGVVLAALLAVVLFAGVGTGTGVPSVEQRATASDLQPGINGATSLLLSLTVFPTSSRPTAPAFTLTDQYGQPVSPAAFKGKVVVISANDDRCRDLCTLLANDIVAANHDLGPAAKDVVWLGINANPFYPQVSAVKQWTDEHGLASQPNWYFSTSTPAVLKQVWHEYGVEVQQDAKTRTISHSTEMFFVDPSGHERAVTEFGASAASTDLFAHGIAQMADDLLPAASRVHVKGPETPNATATNATVGATAPNFDLPYLDRPGRLSLSSLRGHYTVVNFWSSTCTVCRTELPHIEAAYKSVAGQVAFVGVDVADSAGPARSMASAAGLTYPLVADRHGSASGGEKITGLPYTVILGPSGKVLVRHPGNITTEQLLFVLESLDPSLPNG